MCRQCETAPVYEFTNRRKLCKKCFIEYLEKKFFYAIRKFHMIKSGDVIGYKTIGGFRDTALEKMLEIFSKKADIKLAKNSKTLKADKIAISSAIDLEAEEIVRMIIDKNAKEKEMRKLSPVNGRIIKPLYLFLDEEVLLYAKLTGLKFKKQKEKKERVHGFLDELEKKHPEIKRAIVNSYLKIYEK